MRKNKMLRMASGLFVLTMLTTSIIGGTFAKYTTTGSASDTARVAKWGVAITTSGSLYSNAYANANATDGNLPAAWNANPTADAITVATATNTGNDNIVAPGTKSYENGLSFGISGTPEVAVNVETTITAEDIFLAKGTYGVLVPATVNDTKSLQKVVKEHTEGVYGLSSGAYTKVKDSDDYKTGTAYYILTNEVTLNADYFPVKYTLGGSTTDANVTTAVAAAAKLATAIDNSASAGVDSTKYKATYSNISANFDANTDLGAEGPKFKNENLAWEWAIGGNDEDPKDTILGDLIAARGETTEYKVVSVSADDAVTALTINTADGDYTVTSGTGAGATVVANLRTMFDIKLDVTQID